MPSPANSPITVLIGRNLDRAIRDAGLTNRAVGEMIGATEHQVWRWRKGHKQPSDHYLMALAAKLFDGDLQALYADSPDRKAAA